MQDIHNYFKFLSQLIRPTIVLYHLIYSVQIQQWAKIPSWETRGWTGIGVKRSAVQDFTSVLAHPSSSQSRSTRITSPSGLTISWPVNLNLGDASMASTLFTYRAMWSWRRYCSIRHTLTSAPDRSVKLFIVACSVNTRRKKIWLHKACFSSLIVHFCFYIFIWVYTIYLHDNFCCYIRLFHWLLRPSRSSLTQSFALFNI